MERYRSGHNEAVLKTVCPKGRMGSNPILSAGDNSKRNTILYNSIYSATLGEVPKLAEVTPLERVQVVNSGARVQIPPSPFGMCWNIYISRYNRKRIYPDSEKTTKKVKKCLTER